MRFAKRAVKSRGEDDGALVEASTKTQKRTSKKKSAARRRIISPTRERYAPMISAKPKSPSILLSPRERREETVDMLAPIPIIDRIPTAMGYQSDSSEEEWLEEKSRCSRYDVEDDDTDDRVVSFDGIDHQREMELDEDEEQDHDDKYSRKCTTNKKKKNKIKKKTKAEKKKQPETISRLWSDSLDEDVPPPTWNRLPPSRLQLEIDNMDMESQDPIYESSPKSTEKKRPRSKRASRKLERKSRRMKAESPDVVRPTELKLDNSKTKKSPAEVVTKNSDEKDIAKTPAVVRKEPQSPDGVAAVPDRMEREEDWSDYRSTESKVVHGGGYEMSFDDYKVDSKKQTEKGPPEKKKTDSISSLGDSKRPEKKKSESISSLGDSKPRMKLSKSPFDEVSTIASERGDDDSTTSSLTDPLDNMLNHGATKQVVKEIEQKLKLLKKVAKQEQKAAAQEQKAKAKKKKEAAKKQSSKKTSSKESSESKPKRHSSSKSIPKDAEVKKRSSKKTSSKGSSESGLKKRSSSKRIPQVTEAKKRSNKKKTSSKESSKSKTKKHSSSNSTRQGTKKQRTKGGSKSKQDDDDDSKSKDKIEIARTTTDSTDPVSPDSSKPTSKKPKRRRRKRSDRSVEVAEANKSWVSMYSKSLSNGSNVGHTAKSSVTTNDSGSDPEEPGTPDKPEMALYMQSMLSFQTEDSEKSAERGRRKKVSRKWNFGIKKRLAKKTAKTNEKEKAAQECDRDTKLLQAQTTETAEESPSQHQREEKKAEHQAEEKKVVKAQDPIANAISKTKKKPGPSELDEYSASMVTNSNEPSLVQCLRFYACGAVADKVDVAIKVVDCGCGNVETVADFGDDDNILETWTRAPRTSAEALFDDESLVPPKRNPLSCTQNDRNDDASDEDYLQEIPALPLSKVPSIVLDVTKRHLHLDGDEMIEESTLNSTSTFEHSITTIRVPSQSDRSRRSDFEKQPSRSQDSEIQPSLSEEMPLEEFLESGKKNRFGKLFSFFRKKTSD